MSYSARKLVIRAASSLILGLVLVGCQGGGGSGSGSGSSEADRSSNQDNTQQTAGVAPDSAVLSWTHPEGRMDGTDFDFHNVGHYVVYWGEDPDNLSNQKKIECANCVDMEYEVSDLSDGTWYFSVTTVDKAGRESPKADPVSKTI